MPCRLPHPRFRGLETTRRRSSRSLSDLCSRKAHVGVGPWRRSSSQGCSETGIVWSLPALGLGKGPVCCSASMCCRSQAQPHQSWFSRSFRRLSNSRPRTQTTINGEPSGLRDETASGEEDISSGTQWKPSFDRHLGVGESDLRWARTDTHSIWKGTNQSSRPQRTLHHSVTRSLADNIESGRPTPRYVVGRPAPRNG